MTINNYDDTDLAMIKNGYPDFCREVIWTLEAGEKTGTPHIQAFIKLQRQQRLSFVRKLFPRGSFKPLTSDDWILNAKRYVQKDDETTRSAHVQKFNDPIHTMEVLIPKVAGLIIEAMNEKYGVDNWAYSDVELTEKRMRTRAERQLVSQNFRYAKIFTSASYKRMWEEFGTQMVENLLHTHTHTHNEEKMSRVGGITNAPASEDSETASGGDAESADQDDEDYEEGCRETDEGHSEGTGSVPSEENDNA